jgi:hypothetical protein
LKYGQATFRHVPQLSGNGREDGQKGKYRREKSWDSEIVIDNQQKSGVREQSLKKRDHDFVPRREGTRSKAIDQIRRGEISMVFSNRARIYVRPL